MFPFNAKICKVAPNSSFCPIVKFSPDLANIEPNFCWTLNRKIIPNLLFKCIHDYDSLQHRKGKMTGP